MVHSVLSAVLPSIGSDDIMSTRLLRTERQDTNVSNASESERHRTPWVVCLSRRELVDSIMRAKSKLTAFSTKNIDASPLTQETCNSLVQRIIFINELLNKERFLQFNYLKSIVRGLGFKYIWHRSGRFLIKR